MNYDNWKTNEPDPCEWDMRRDGERCPDCEADEGEPCSLNCSCYHCKTRRLTLMDIIPENEVA